MPKLTAIATLLEPAERARLMELGPSLLSSPKAIELMNTLAPQAPELAAEWVRNHLDEIEARFGSWRRRVSTAGERCRRARGAR